MPLKTTEETKKKATVSLATAAAAEEISVDAAGANAQSGLDGIFTIKAEQRVELKGQVFLLRGSADGLLL